VFNGAHKNYRVLYEEEKKGTRARYSMGSEYFLFVGAQHPRKNIDGLLKAFDLFKTNYQSDHKLIVVGEKKFLSQSVEDTYKAMEYKNEVLFTGRLSSEEIALVMGSALALVFIPFFEGFGMPMAEAMYAEIPIIASNTTSMPEVAGEAAIYVDPHNPESIVEAMNSMASDSSLRERLVDNGIKRRGAFNWDISAKILWHSIERSL
jgi:glycosyltransferase involved in cell wall biosynthesis